jgi:hypothetical protein
MGGMTRKRFLQYIGLGLTPWWMVLGQAANYFRLDIPAEFCWGLVAMALFGFALVLWAERSLPNLQ